MEFFFLFPPEFGGAFLRRSATKEELFPSNGTTATATGEKFL